MTGFTLYNDNVESILNGSEALSCSYNPEDAVNKMPAACTMMPLHTVKEDRVIVTTITAIVRAEEDVETVCTKQTTDNSDRQTFYMKNSTFARPDASVADDAETTQGLTVGAVVDGPGSGIVVTNVVSKIGLETTPVFNPAQYRTSELVTVSGNPDVANGQTFVPDYCFGKVDDGTASGPCYKICLRHVWCTGYILEWRNDYTFMCHLLVMPHSGTPAQLDNDVLDQRFGKTTQTNTKAGEEMLYVCLDTIEAVANQTSPDIQTIDANFNMQHAAQRQEPVTTEAGATTMTTTLSPNPDCCFNGIYLFLDNPANNCSGAPKPRTHSPAFAPRR